MEENLLKKRLIGVLKTVITLLSVLTIIIIIYLIPAWIPVKYAVKEDSFDEYKDYILVKDSNFPCPKLEQYIETSTF